MREKRERNKRRGSATASLHLTKSGEIDRVHEMRAEYEVVETLGSPDVIPSTTEATEPSQPFAAVSSLTAINMHHDGSSNPTRKQTKSPLMQQKRKHLKMRLNDIARSRNWKMCQKVLFVLGILGVGLLASFMIFRFIRTDEFNLVIEWIQVCLRRVHSLCILLHLCVSASTVLESRN